MEEWTAADCVAYSLMPLLVDHLTFPWTIRDYEHRICQGLFAPLLPRPVHPIRMDTADNLTHTPLAGGRAPDGRV